MSKATGKWIQYGREFGYPECCISFFCYAWSHAIGQDWLSTVYADLGFKLGFRWIPCPACMRERCMKMTDAEIRHARAFVYILSIHGRQDKYVFLYKKTAKAYAEKHHPGTDYRIEESILDLE